ncbi:MAG TPA: hypothetical protein VJ044_02025 [Candidatus Hodarchaeales archaeon]|nr:hypothetical protein [Candidatus Hodarchaeales archaeon]
MSDQIEPEVLRETEPQEDDYIVELLESIDDHLDVMEKLLEKQIKMLDGLTKTLDTYEAVAQIARVALGSGNRNARAG